VFEGILGVFHSTSKLLCIYSTMSVSKDILQNHSWEMLPWPFW